MPQAQSGQVVLLDDRLWFPDPEHAMQDPDGLLAIGGDLSSARLIQAYSQGIFPWFSENDPILWWSPDPRAYYPLDRQKPSRSLRKRMTQADFTLKVDTQFRQVINSCAAHTPTRNSTWITTRMIDAYIKLHDEGICHSIEVWQNEQLVGGLYGLAIGGCFFGESMFTLEKDASKIAFVYLAHLLSQHGYALLDCQMPNDHLMSLGAQPITRQDYLQWLNKALKLPVQLDWYNIEAMPSALLREIITT